MSNKTSTAKKKQEEIKIIVACKYPLLREGISKILEDDSDISVVARISNLIDLIEACEEQEFDVILLDVDLRGLNLTKILSFIKKIKGAKIILIVDNDYNENLLINAIRSGVRGYLLKDTDSQHLVKSVKAVSSGELWVERKIMGKVVDGNNYSSKGEGKNGSKQQIYELTETEIKIIKLVLNGCTNKDIANELYISEKTVKFHLYKVFKKLSVKNRSELILFGFRHGFIS